MFQGSCDSIHSISFLSVIITELDADEDGLVTSGQQCGVPLSDESEESG